MQYGPRQIITESHPAFTFPNQPFVTVVTSLRCAGQGNGKRRGEGLRLVNLWHSEHFSFLFLVNTTQGVLRQNLPVIFTYLAYFKPKHLLKVSRLTNKQQVKSPASAEVRNNYCIDWHRCKKFSPWSFVFLKHRTGDPVCILIIINNPPSPFPIC